MQKNKTSRSFSHRYTRHDLRQAGILHSFRPDDYCAHAVDACQFERDAVALDSAGRHSIEVYTQHRDSLSGIESARNIYWHNRRFCLTWRSCSTKPNANAGKHRLNLRGQGLALDHMAGPEYAAATKERGHELLPKANFIGGKPGRGRSTEQSREFLADFIVFDIRFKITENLLKTHLVEVGFIEFRRSAPTRLILPEPVIDQTVFGNQSLHLLRSESSRSVVGPSIRRYFLMQSGTSNRLQQHVTPKFGFDALQCEMIVNLSNVLSKQLPDIFVIALGRDGNR